MTSGRHFWVRWSGTIACEDGSFDSMDPDLRAFLRALSFEFSRNKTLTQPSVICPGDGSISLSSVVEAKNSGDAVNTAKDSFEEAIRAAGGFGNLPDGEHPSWKIRELIRLFEAQVRELDLAA